MAASGVTLKPRTYAWSRWTGLGVFLGFFAWAFAMNWVRGALSSGFGAFEDEAAHLVTGLMVRDFLVGGDYGHPLAYAKDYYLHYPKVGIGQWPPVFYTLQGFWYIAFGTSKVAIVALLSLLSATTAWLVARTLSRPAGPLLGIFGGLLFLNFDSVESYGSGVMTEMLLALGCLAASVAWGYYLEQPRLSRALTFGSLAAVAILIKGNALCLALVPPLSLLVYRHFFLLKRRDFWLSALPVMLLCFPWFFFTLGVSQGSWAGGTKPSISYAINSSVYYGRGLVGLGGWTALLTVSYAVIRSFVAGRRERAQWSALAALLPAVVIFHLVVPSSRDFRHLMLLAPAWAYFSILGASQVSVLIANRTRTKAWAWLVLFMGFFALENYPIVRKDYRGYEGVVQDLSARPEFKDSVFLIASDSIGDGLWISAFALSEERPGHVVLRASNVLCESNWIGTEYSCPFETAEELDLWLQAVPVGVVAFDRATNMRQWFPHHDLLDEVLHRENGPWKLMDRHTVVRQGVVFPNALEIYVLEGHQELPKRALDPSEVLGELLD